MKKSERVRWVDVCKGLAIILVVLGHVYKGNALQTWLYSFHMPLFFMLSGWIRGNKGAEDNLSFIKKQAVGLLWPCVLFECLTYIYWIVIESHFREFDVGPVWFLVVLLIVEVICNAFVMNRSQITTFVLMLACLLVLWLGALFVESTSLVAWIPRTAGGMTFYLAGLLLSKHENIFEIQHNMTKTRLPVYFLVGVAVTIVLSQMNGKVDLNTLKTGNIAIYFIAAVTGTAMMCCLSMLINKNKILEFFGRYSIIVLCTHEPVKRAVIFLAGKLAGMDNDAVRNMIIPGIVIAGIVLLIEVPVIYVFRFLAQKTRKPGIASLFAFVK